LARNCEAMAAAGGSAYMNGQLEGSETDRY